MKKFVEMYRKAADVNLDRSLKPDLPPFIDKDKASTAHFFLLAASLDESKVVRRAENVRILLSHLHDKCFQSALTRIVDKTQFENALAELRTCEFYSNLGPERESIADILSSVNRFVHDYVPNRNLIEYSEIFKTPKEFAEKLTTDMEARGIRFRQKAWIYLRWMIRGPPDLSIFTKFGKEELLMPITTPTLRVAVALNLIDDKRVVDTLKMGREITDSWWTDVEAVEKARTTVTDYSRHQLGFADDPVKADYPFFVLGRWLSGLNLDGPELQKSLRLFGDIYQQTKRPPIEYPVLKFYDNTHYLQYKRSRKMASFYKGGLEPKIAERLHEKHIPFEYESLQFRLPVPKFKQPYRATPYSITHTPDFILPRNIIDGKRVDLEPHWFWHRDDATRFSKFREFYRDYFKLVLIADALPFYIREGKEYDYHWHISPWYPDYYVSKLDELKTVDRNRSIDRKANPHKSIDR